MKFVHLHTHSHYSLLDGLSKPDALVKRAKELGMEALALTDHGNLYGSVEFYKKAKAAGLKPIIGAEVYVARSSRLSKIPKVDNVRYHLTLLAKNKTGYLNLVALVTKAHLEGFYYKPRVDRELLERHHEGIICLSGCYNGELSRNLREKNFKEAEGVVKYYKGLFGEDYYLEIQPHSPELHQSLVELSKKFDLTLVATQDSHYIYKEDAPVHEVLLAIQTNNHLGEEKRFSMAEFDGWFTSAEEMAEKLKAAPEAIENTLKVAEKCNFEFELGQTLLPEFETPKGQTSMDYLRELATERLPQRFAEPTPEVHERLNYELGVIEKTGFADYFLIVQDYVVWAKEHGIVVGPGRGSAAGSLVSYVLGITEVDPLKYDLLFERFLNPERISMPDIDIDFADYRRDEVLSYVRDKYGEDRVAQIITFGTMAARASVRDAGRALGLPYSFCDELAKLIPFEPNTAKENKLPIYLKGIPELKERYEKDEDARRLLDVAVKLEGTIRHASVHACGTVISADALTNHLPLQRSPQDDNVIITQIEMHGVEDLGLLKMDFLGLSNLTIIEETLKLIRDHSGEEIRISQIPLDDKEVFRFLQTGEMAGIFQFESAGMRRYMKELAPTQIEDLVALGALYRPGPIELIPSFINRKHGREEVSYLHPKLEPILKNTYGVGVYQEQMMRIARDLAGFSLPEADTLRKAIGKKIKSLLDEQQKKITDGLIKNGIDPKIAQKIWDLFPPFARYGFNKSHAVCYALISYQTAYLKTHYPVEFMTALLNHAGGDVERVAFLAAEAERMKIKILPPDVNASLSHFFPEGKDIRYGLATIKNLGENIAEAIVAERLHGGPYENLTDFVGRIDHKDLNKKSLEALTKTGAIDVLGVERNQLLANLDKLVKTASALKKGVAGGQGSLFGSSGLEIHLEIQSPPTSKTEELAWEKELLGIYFTEHPLKEFIAKNKSLKYSAIRDVLTRRDGEAVRTFGFISKIQRVSTKKGEPMIFAKIEDLSNTIEVLVFNGILERKPDIWKENNIVEIGGRISRKNGEPKIICSDVQILNL